MELPIPNKIKKLWEAGNLRGCIMLSLFLQAFLVSFASSRQRSKSKLLLLLIWSAYLLADWVAAIAIGLITKSQMDLCGLHEGGKNDNDLYAFWPSFLLLHLGGPDTITSFALEDNEFWLRHRFGLILQVMAAAYSIYLTLPTNKLWLPTVLVFVVGTVKYGERTYALYLASYNRFRYTWLPDPEPGPDYEKVTAAVKDESDGPECSAAIERDYYSLRVCSSSITDNDETKLLHVAYKLFESFKGLIFGLFLSFHDRKASRQIFMETDCNSAFRVIEHELSLIYEVLHTKVVVLTSGTIGYIARFISFCFIVIASLLFLLAVEKNTGNTAVGSAFRNKFDIGLTYALLVGAIVLDSLSFVQLICSDWALVGLRESWRRYIPWVMMKRRRRWHGSIFQYDMINYCLDKRRPIFMWLKKLLGRNSMKIPDWLKIALFSSSENVSEDMKQFIFEKLINAPYHDQPEHYSSSTEGNSGTTNTYFSEAFNLRIEKFMKVHWRMRYEHSLLRFLAGNLAIDSINYHQFCDKDRRFNIVTVTSPELRDKHIRLCKAISNYMFHLLVTQPKAFSPVVGDYWKETLQDVCDELKAFFDKHKITSHLQACKKIKDIWDEYKAYIDKHNISRQLGEFEKIKELFGTHLEENNTENTSDQILKQRS